MEAFTLPLADINAQNTRMQDGEDKKQDIARHVDECISANHATWDGWLSAARAASGPT